MSDLLGEAEGAREEQKSRASSLPYERVVFSPATPGQMLIVKKADRAQVISEPTRLVDLTGGFLLEYLPKSLPESFLTSLSDAATLVAKSRLKYTKKQGRVKQYIFGDWRRYSQDVYSTNCSKTVVGKFRTFFFLTN